MRNAARLLLIPLSVLLLAACGKNIAYKQPPVEPSLAETPQDDRGMYLDLLRQMQAQGAYFASLAHIDAFRQRFGDSPELRILLADALRETGDGNAAANVYRGLLKGAQAGPAWHGLGLVAASNKDMEGARQALQSAVRADPLNTVYLGDLGFALLQAGQLPEARAPLAKAAELAPDNARAISNLALWALLSGQPGVAEGMIERAGLPQATRLEIYRLAQSLRRTTVAATATAASLPAAASALAAHEATDTPTALRPLPPGSMLERFSPPPAKPQEIVQ